MTLQEFLTELREAVDDFETHYRKGYEAEPEKWPLEYEMEGDWYEQFLAFLATQEA